MSAIPSVPSPPRSRLKLTLLPPIRWILIAAVVGAAAAAAPNVALAVLLVALCIAASALVTPTALLSVLLILAPLRTLYATEAPRLGLPAFPLDIGQWLVLAFIAVWLVHKLVTRDRLAFLNRGELQAIAPTLVPLSLFVIIAGLSAFTALSMTAWVTEWLKWAQVMFIALIVFDMTRQNSVQTVIALLVAAGTGNALIGIYEYFGGSGALHLVINETHFRAFGTFGQPNPFGGYMGIIFPLALASALAQGLAAYHALKRGSAQMGWRLGGASLLYAGCALVVGAALILSWSRGAWLGLGVSIVIMVLAYPRRFGHSLAWVVIAALLAAGLVLSGRLPATIVERLSSITEDIFDVQDVRGVDIDPQNYAVIERLAHWQAALNMASERPWLGVGLGNYEAAYPQFRLINWKFPLGHAHNMYLNMLAEVGIFGLVAYLAFIFANLWYSWRIRSHPDFARRLLGIGLLGVWVYVAVHSLTDNLYVNNLFIHLSVTVGVIAALTCDIPRATKHAI